jgi:hypothetical protein
MARSRDHNDDETAEIIDPLPQTPLPERRMFVVRRLNPYLEAITAEDLLVSTQGQGQIIQEIVVEAHKIEVDQDMAAFADFVRTPFGVTVEIHRVFYNISEVEEIHLGAAPRVIH